MRIGLLIYDTLERNSGGYLYDRMLVRCLEKSGDRVETVSIPGRNYRSHLSDNFSRPLYETLLKLDVDILLQDELNHPSLFLLNPLVRREVSYGVVSIVHHLRCCEPRPAWQNLYYREVEARYLRSLDGFVFVSEDTARAVRFLLGKKPPSVVVYPGKDRFSFFPTPDFLRDKIYRARTVTLLFAGNVIPRKGLHLLLKALERVKGPDWRLEVAGSLDVDARYARSIVKYAGAGRLAERVTFLGHVSDLDLEARMKKAHLLAVPSLYEGFGIVYLEALGCGVPVIASAAGGAGEIVSDGAEGFLIPPGNVELLAARLEEALLDRRRLHAMSLQAYRRSLSFPTWDESAAKVRDFLGKLGNLTHMT